MAITRVNCIGFSVTAYMDNSYPKYLAELLMQSHDQGYVVNYVSLGGLAIDSLPFLIKKIWEDYPSEIVVLEIATSWFSLYKKSQVDANNYILQIVDYLELTGCRIVFLNLFRADIPDNDLVVRAIELVNSGKYPIIDLKARFRELSEVSNIKVTVDGVHPTEDGIKIIANDLATTITQLSIDSSLVKLNRSCPNRLELWNPEIFDVERILFDNRKGFVAYANKISAGQEAIYEFSEGVIISGIFYVMGPDTGYTNLSIDDRNIEIDMFDEMSFYRRLGFAPIDPVKAKRIKVMHPKKKSGTLLKREPGEKVDGVNAYIIGFAVTCQ